MLDIAFMVEVWHVSQKYIILRSLHVFQEEGLHVFQERPQKIKNEQLI